MLLDEYVPHYDVREIHSVPTHASSPVVFRKLQTITPADLPLVRILMTIRSAPALLFGGASLQSDENTPFLDQIMGSGFLFLGETENEYLVGTIGKFWRPTGELCSDILTAEEFKKFKEPGWAKAGWNFRVEGEGDKRRIRTETRIVCTDESSRRKFRLYWWFVRPGSGVIRKSILKALQ
ncbi:MAG: hypothetical protein HYZ01_02930 [Ignavibacteriales bacterium]|nr:hypothetical protein [Ignavibacteriales bacterium]